MNVSLQHAITAIKSGDRKTGQQLLAHTLLNNPNDEHAWLWMSGVVDSDEQRRQCLERVLTINPANIQAQRGLISLLTRWSASLKAQHTAQQHTQQQLIADRAILAADQAARHINYEKIAAEYTILQSDQATLRVQHEQLIAECMSLEQAQAAIHIQQEQFTNEHISFEQAQQALSQRTLKLTKREQRAKTESKRLQAWNDQLSKQEETLKERERYVWQQQFAHPRHTVLDPPILKNGVYSLSPRLDQLFYKQIVEPHRQARNSQLWKDIDVERNKQAITGGGQADFCLPYKGLSAEDRVLLYCYANMRMHFYSSYHIFNTYRNQLHAHILDGYQRVLFVDIGCGPFTCGLAFNAFTHGLPQKPHVTYIGVDRAPAMLAKAEGFNQHGDYVDRFVPCTDYNQIPETLREHVSGQEQLAIIINMSYFFASPTLDIQEFTTMMHNLTDAYKHCPICIVYQDPIDHDTASPNWHTFSDYFQHFEYIAEAVEETVNYRLSEDKKATLKYNILTNQPCGAKRKTHATTQSARHSAGRIPTLPARRSTRF